MCGTRSDARPIFLYIGKIDVRKCVPQKKSYVSVQFGTVFAIYYYESESL